MYLGRIVEMGDKQELFSKPLHPYTQALMEAIPIPNPERKKKRAELRSEVPSAIDMSAGCRFRTRCSYEEKTCREKEPELVAVSPNHFVACERAAK
ncbi:hypothetical protein A3K79_03430 [Candidatus Bathyarchaeota archaeon RBG_13_46_16b]|nr:MAG: hypothetical protein A3K79_03430 [Candidatus Bathyarchaeota archaeon RBG_13_46_16b]